MYGCIKLEELVNSGNTNLVKEFFGDYSWRILSEDAKPEDKFVAEMVFDRLDDKSFPGHEVAHGWIYNDSRGIWLDGERIRTSTVKNIFTNDGETYIETRNTLYKLILRKEELITNV